MLRSAKDMEREYAIPRRTSYFLAKQGLVPCYRVGRKGRGLRFNPQEVLNALRQKRSAPVEEKVET